MSGKERDEHLSEIHLGSNGYLYDGAIPEGRLLCRPWSSSEEMLLNSSVNAHVLIDKLIAQTCELPSGLKPEDLTVHDRFQIFVHGRNISYSRPYQFTYRCEECDGKASATIDLRKDLDIRYLGRAFHKDPLTGEPVKEQDGSLHYTPFDFEYPVTVELPLSGHTISWRFLTGKDEKATDTYERKVRAKNPHIIGDPTYHYSLALRIVEIDGKKLSFAEALDFVRRKDSIVGDDSLVLRDSFDDNAHGYTMLINPTCNLCGWEHTDLPLPMSRSFFRPAAKVGNSNH